MMPDFFVCCSRVFIYMNKKNDNQNDQNKFVNFSKFSFFKQS